MYKTITLDVSSIGIHTHPLVLLIYYSIIRLHCLQPIVLGIILMNLTQGMSFAPKIIHNLRVLLERRDPADINLLCYNSFLYLDSAIIALLDMVPYEVLRVSTEFRVFPMTLGLQPCIHKEFDFVVFYIGLIDYALLSFWHSIPICLKCNIMNHISDKH